MSFSCMFFLLFLYTILTPAYSARILLDVADPPQAFQHPTQPSITFIMQDIQPSTKNPINPQQQQQQQQQQALPFSKPLGTFSLTYGGNPIPYQTNPNNDRNTFTQTATDMPRFGIIFPTASTIQEELEFGSVTNIEENIYVENTVFGPTVVGKAKGVYVAMSSSSDNNHMMAMTVSFSVENGDDDDDKSSDEIDSLKFFGVPLRDVIECHVAVIGGTGKFNDANGYAVIKVVNNRDIGSTDIIHGSSDDVKLMLMYNVFLS